MTKEKPTVDIAPETPKTPAPEPRKNRLPLILGVIFLVLLIVGGIIGGLIFFGVINLNGETTPTPTATPFNPLDPLAEYDECAPLLTANPNRYCRMLEIESDSTWSNSSLTSAELITEDMAIAPVAYPGAVWISPINPQQAIEKVFYLPEGEIEVAEVRIGIASSYPIASITINSQTFYPETNFPAWEDAYPLDLLLSRPNLNPATPDATVRLNLRQYLQAGQNVIRFQFADEDVLATPEATVSPEATVDPNATPVPPPTYALLAQVKIPVTGVYNTVQREVYFSNADWQDAPNVGYLPTATDAVMGDALWIQGQDRPNEGQETVTVERVFYLAEAAPNYALMLDVRNGTLASIKIINSVGEAQQLLLPPSGGTTITEGESSFQRYEGIPLSTGFSVGLNRLVVAYAPNSSVNHALRLRMNDSEGQTVFLSDAQWLRGDYQASSEVTGESVTLTAAVQRGTAHLRGFVGIPNIVDERARGNLIINCLQERGEVPCSTIQIRHENSIYTFGSGDTPASITLEKPQRLLSLDVSFQSDIATEDFATVRLSMNYLDATGVSQNISAASVWYSYRDVTVLTNVDSALAVVPDASFISSAQDNNEGDYISVFETSLTLPENAVVIEAQALGSVDDHLLAIYINDYLAYQGDGSREDFRQVNTFVIDAALLRAGENRIVAYTLNRLGAGALAMRFDIRYFTQRSSN